ncbi:MAG: hypothetical protein QOF30_3021 [Acidimicrobiaceae bacterium]|nr:hypothetical protein [Acidimicrobiaceae bacterium]
MVPTRRWRVLSVVLLPWVIAACSSTKSGSTSTTTRAPSGGADTTSPASTAAGTAGTAPAGAAASGTTRPKVLVAITTSGAVQALDPTTGRSLRTLATGAIGEEIGLSPDGLSVFYETPVGCTHQVNRVPTAGGARSVIASGGHPTVSPDGTLLAYTRQPDFTASTSTSACQAADTSAAAFSVVVRELATGRETNFPLPPAVVAGGLPLPIAHLSWAADNRRLAVSIGGGQDNEQWSVSIMDRTQDKYYANAASVPVSGPERSYYREAAFLPSGDLFVDRECCAGYPPQVTSSVLATVDAATGATHQQVAIGVTTRDHASLDVDGTGHWLLYLSGPDLLISNDGARPTTLASGFQAAAW